MNKSILKMMFYTVTVISFSVLMSLSVFAAEQTINNPVIPEETTSQTQQEPTTEAPEEPAKSGFVNEDGELYYYLPESGERFIPACEGVYVFEGKAYLFTKEGKTVRYNPEEKFTSFSGQKYCINIDNSLFAGLVTYNGATYCFYPDTYRLTKGWVTLEGKKRYFDSNGKMLKWLSTISGKTYYFDSNGIMKTGFVTFKEGKRYFGSDGVMRTGLTTVSKNTYYFDSKGIMKTGWIDFKKDKRYFSKKTGVMLKGKKKIAGKYYYFNSSGIMKTGWITIDGSKYYFSKKKSYMLKGWNKIGGEYYYFKSNGKMVKSAIVGNYYVLSNGKRAESSAVSYAVKAVKAATTDKMTQEQKLKACYNWIIKNFSYERDYQDPAKLKNNWTKSYAEYAFKKKKGNCYKYASAMGYCAEILGYEARVVYGKIASGSSRTNHGWTEIKINGKYYIFDTVQADYYKGNYYKRTYKNYPRTLYKSGTKSITLS